MSFRKFILTTAFALMMLAGGLITEASAQRRVVYVRRPVVVRNYVYSDPFWRTRYYGYSPFYDSYYQSPYEQYQERRFYLQRELVGNQRELAKHQREYRMDGVITAKEARELADDIKDVRESTQRLRSFGRNY
ncbi:MAG TPA: hypothetical protein VMZ26_09145 [Pyrinomonadaceae bacterium]|nr:hypothetical protein [Pyrinomonadaceae bacterium]